MSIAKLKNEAIPSPKIACGQLDYINSFLQCHLHHVFVALVRSDEKDLFIHVGPIKGAILMGYLTKSSSGIYQIRKSFSK